MDGGERHVSITSYYGVGNNFRDPPRRMDYDQYMLYFLLEILYALCVILPALFYHTNIPITMGVALGYMLAVGLIFVGSRSLEIALLVGIALATFIVPNIPKR